MSEIAMKNHSVLERMDRLEQKLDLILENLSQQELKEEETRELGSELSNIANHVFKGMVKELDKQNLQFELDSVMDLFTALVRNLPTLVKLVKMLEDANDLISEVSPIANDAFRNSVLWMEEKRQKGYFEFINELGDVFDNILTNFSTKDVKDLADNVVLILDTIKTMTQPDMLKALKNGINVYKSLDATNVPEYSIWRVIREMNSKEMKRGFGFAFTFLKNVSKEKRQIN